ncbi:MAG: Holliday junction resolvase [Nanoarchaeota archaeon]|nr:Holliday junction resolvase [Nanoarchaeota archaeon]
MSHKSKGINAERDLVHMFWKVGWGSCRIAGSGSMKYPSPDIIAAKKTRRLAIECKVTKDNYKHLEKKGIEELKGFARLFDAEPYIAVKFKGNEWFFIKTGDLKEKGGSFRVDLELANDKGIGFESLII